MIAEHADDYRSVGVAEIVDELSEVLVACPDQRNILLGHRIALEVRDLHLFKFVYD